MNPSIHRRVTPPEIIISKDAQNIYLASHTQRNEDILKKYKDTKYYLKINSLDKFLKFRFSFDFGIGKINKSLKLEDLQLLGLSLNPLELEIRAKKFIMNSTEHTVAPFKVSNLIQKLELSDMPKIPKHVSKVYYDTDMKATEALSYLYNKHHDIPYISQIMSVGCVGKKQNRRIVPTKYAITASDSIISQKFIDKIKEYEPLKEIMVFEGEIYHNHLIIIFLPSYFSYELIEVVIHQNKTYRDFETFESRTQYAHTTGGGYYAVRLAIAEKLNDLEKQAKVIVIREIKPEYYRSAGVWVLREGVREILKGRPHHVKDIKNLHLFIKQKVLSEHTIHQFLKSKILRDHIKQRKLF